MKQFKRIAAVLIAAMMVLGTMNLSVLAAVGERAKDPQLVVSGLEKGDVVRFYKILEENDETADMTGWIYTSSFVGMSSTENVPVSTITGYTNRTPAVSMGLTADIAGKLARMSRTANATVYGNPVTVESDGKATLSNPEPGLYMAIITAADPDTVYNPVFVSCDFVATNGSANKSVAVSQSEYSDGHASKKSKLTILKSAKTSEDYWDDKSAYTTAIGDTVEFVVDTYIPGYGGVYEEPTFEMEDKLTALTLNTNSVKVYADGRELENTNYTIATSTDNYKITFNKNYLKTLYVPTPIQVKYSAIVATSALYSVNVENNEVGIKYSTNPTDSTDFAVKKDETNHYTFTIDANALFSGESFVGHSGSEIVKVGRDAAGNPINSITTSSWVQPGESVSGPLEGAKFKLYTKKDNGTYEEYIPKKADGTSNGTGLALESDNQGRILIPGLDAGTYYLKETDAPQGYIKDPNYYEIKIEATINEEKITEYYYKGTWYSTLEEAERIAATNENKALIRKYEYYVDVLTICRITVDGVTVNGDAIQNSKTTVRTFTHDSSDSAIKWHDHGQTELISSIVNTQGVELPSTGGIGTTLFYAGGAVLVLLAGILLVSKRRAG